MGRPILKFSIPVRMSKWYVRIGTFPLLEHVHDVIIDVGINFLSTSISQCLGLLNYPAPNNLLTHFYLAVKNKKVKIAKWMRYYDHNTLMTSLLTLTSILTLLGRICNLAPVIFEILVKFPTF